MDHRPCARSPPLRSGCCAEFLLTKLNTSPTIRASVASLRQCSPSARNGVRLPSGMLFSLAEIPSSMSSCLRANFRIRFVLALFTLSVWSLAFCDAGPCIGPEGTGW
jgi:hypothetical protein